MWEVRASGVALRRHALVSGTWTPIKAGTEFIGEKAITRALIGDAAMGTAQIADLSVTNAKIGDLNAGKITAGTIDTARLNTQQVAAAVGVFIDAMMQHLTVAGIANINELVADELFAKLAVVDKLQALTSIITKDMIATGSVTTDKFAANAINAAMIDVGLDARWDSTGLHFYLPASAGQDPVAWDQRQKLISLAPAGNVEVNVADGNAITAGLVGTSGTVWGKKVEAGELILAGKPFVPVDGPRGTVGLTRAGNNTSVSNTNRRVMGVRAPLYKGRMYEFRYNLGLSRTSGDVQVQTFLEYGSTTVQIGQYNVSADGDFTSAVVFDADEYAFADGQDVMVVCYLRTTSSGATGTLWANTTHKPSGSWVHLQDTGPSVPIYVQSLTAPTNPKRTYTQRFWQTGGKQFRGDGGSLQSSDSRWIVGGRVFGADNPDQLWFRFNFDPLIGSTIKSASLTIKCTQTYQSGQTSFLDIGYSGAWDTPGSVPGNTTFQAGHGFTAGQTRSCGISGGAASGLASGGFKSIVLKPTYPGSTNSYMDMDTGLVYVDVTYEK